MIVIIAYVLLCMFVCGRNGFPTTCPPGTFISRFDDEIESQDAASGVFQDYEYCEPCETCETVLKPCTLFEDTICLDNTANNNLCTEFSIRGLYVSTVVVFSLVAPVSVLVIIVAVYILVRPFYISKRKVNRNKLPIVKKNVPYEEFNLDLMNCSAYTSSDSSYRDDSQSV